MLIVNLKASKITQPSNCYVCFPVEEVEEGAWPSGYCQKFQTPLHASRWICVVLNSTPPKKPTG